MKILVIWESIPENIFGYIFNLEDFSALTLQQLEQIAGCFINGVDPIEDEDEINKLLDLLEKANIPRLEAAQIALAGVVDKVIITGIYL